MKLNLFPSLFLLLFSLFAFSSYAKTPQEAKDALAKMKITYSEDEFFACAKGGNTDAVKLFLDAGMNPKVKDASGDTPLMWAACKGHTDIVQTLLAKGAEVNTRDKEGATPLISAVISNNIKTIQALLTKGTDVNAKMNNGWTALNIATQNKRSDIVKLLKDAGAKE